MTKNGTLAGSTLEANSEKNVVAKTKDDTCDDAVVIHDKPADFETAIHVAGFGVFNILLILVALPAAIATVFETSTVSYILPSAECDLRLSLIDKGILNAATYAGMITSAFAWGYVADTLGRKKILVFGYLADAVCVISGAFSQNVIHLMISKYFGGFVMCGPFAVLMSYLTELYGKKYRARIMMIVGMMFATAILLLPVLALTILPKNWDFNMMGLSFHSWQIFLAISSIPSIVSGLLLAWFPESPKFLMSQGRNAEALEIFQKIYAINNRKAKESFPIKELVNELQEKVQSIATIETANTTTETTKQSETAIKSNKWLEGFRQLRPLFTKPYLGLSLLVYFSNFFLLFGQNTVRLWLPQLFASIREYEREHLGDGSGPTSMCAILEYSVNKTAMVVSYEHESDCVVVITAASYTNNIIVGISSFCGYLLCGTLVNRIGVKRILFISLAIAGTSAISLYFSSSSLMTVIFSALFVTTGSISGTSLISSSTNLFPTSLRTMIVSLSMMVGRTGSLLGNILFPMFMSFGCIPPFVLICFVMYSACFLSCFIPSTKKISLK